MAETPKNSETSKRTKSWWSKNWFYITLVLVAVIGGGCAFTLPYYFQREGDNIWSLRQAILAATGGVLAILTLWENRRKNIQEKEKNDQDHTRQVHAERRARYAKAIEQLADDKSAIRLGGVYTLAKLVDDWLDDEKTLPSMEKRRQEGQIIIDSLCAYIRSSFPLAERHDELTLSYEEYQQKYQGKNQAIQSVKNSADNSTPKAEKHQDDKQSNQSHEEFVHDKSLFREEKEVRQTILSEIKKRLNGGEIKRENGKNEIKPGTWSYFEYDFLNTVFFYRVGFRNSYFGASLNFSGVKFTEFVDFSGVEFTKGADFSGVKFTKGADFSGVKFAKGADFYLSADFSRAKFTEADFSKADFSEAEFTGSVHFSWAKFTEADFSGATFTRNANFSGATFTRNANFPGAKFTQNANFPGAKFTQNANFPGAKFTQNAYFSGAKFTQDAYFSGAKFTWNANFSKAKFTWNANFPETEFTKNANFPETEFTKNANFSKAKFTSAYFSKAKFTGNTKFSRAKFTKNAAFSWAEFTDTDFTWAEFNGSVYFYRAEFTGNTDFNKATFKYNPIFLTTLRQDGPSDKAKFSNKVDPKYYNFKVSHNSPCIIDTEEQEHNGIKFVIPKDAELFDPDKPSEQDNNDDN